MGRWEEWLHTKNISGYHLEDSQFVNDCLEVVLRDVPGWPSLHDSLYLGLAVEVLDILLGIDQQQLLGSYQVVQQDHCLLVPQESTQSLDDLIQVQDLCSDLTFDLLQGLAIALIVSPLQNPVVLGEVLADDILDAVALLGPLEDDGVFGVDDGQFPDLPELAVDDGAHQHLQFIRPEVQSFHPLDQFVEEPAEVDLTEQLRGSLLVVGHPVLADPCRRPSQ